MKIFFSLLILSIFSHSSLATSSKCTENISNELIKFFEKRDSDARLVLLKNQENKIIGLTDLSGLNPDIILTSIVSIDSNNSKAIYVFDDKETVIVFNQNSCKIKSITGPFLID